MTKMETAARLATEALAVIGMQGRFPGAASVDELWRNLLDGVESIQTFSTAELAAAGISASDTGYPGYVPRGGAIGAIDQFDAGFFGYSPRDAETLDPQQRVFLEVAWEALENAGCDPDRFPGMIGVFAGSDQSSYLYQIYSSIDVSAFGYGGMMAIGNEKDYLATQVSYKLNLRGPSLNIQTSCSTSLVAVVTACQSLAHGYCDMALAGGVAISVPQRKGYWYQPGGIVSPDGHCRAFDAAAMGTVVGNGVGVVVLKRLADALRDGDRVDAVIKGFAINNDGAAKVGYTAPSVDGQAGAIRMAHRMAGIDPATIGYVETHGTATALGDPIEVAALTRAFRDGTQQNGYCAIGSLKSNVGHLSSAAGVSGLIKGILTVREGRVPQSLHYETPNPQIDFPSSPFFVASRTMDWPVQGHPRRAGVSSFGVGGTNAHVVLEQAPPAPASQPADAAQPQLLVLSARTAAALDRATDGLADFIGQHPSAGLADVAHTLQVGRKAFRHRRALIVPGDDRAAAEAALRARDPAWTLTTQTEVAERAVVFMFSGQGTQYVDMGLGLYRTEKTFRAVVDECCAILQGELGFDLRDVLYPRADREGAAVRLKRTELTQPALFTVEYALAQLWMERGLKPDAMLGHSVGEYVAACLAGVIGLRDALSVVAMRGRLMGSMPAGAMLAVPLPEAALHPLLGATVSLAAVNAPTLSVLAGPHEAIEAIERELSGQGLPCTRLHTSHAFHSSMMDPVLVQFTERLSRVKLLPPQIPYLSNVTGQWITPELATAPQYWAAHMRNTVRFADNLREVMAFPDLALIEVGPGHTLQVLAQQQGARAASQLLVPSLRAAQEDAPDDLALLHGTARLWLGGVGIDWRGMRNGEQRAILALPTYPFERSRYWIGALEEGVPVGDDATAARPVPAFAPVGLDGTPMPMPVPAQPPTSQQATDLADWFHVPSWRPALRAAAEGEVSGRWLVLGDGGGIGAAVVKLLRAKGADVAAVVAGDSFGEADGGFRLRPGERADYDALIAALGRRDRMPDRILHLFAMDGATEPSAGRHPAEAFDAAQRRGFYSVVHLCQALAGSGSTQPLRLGLVTDRLHAVTGEETLHAGAATAAAALRAVAQEYPHLRCRTIDVALGQTGIPQALIDDLDRNGAEPSIAYRNARRWTKVYEPVRLNAAQKASPLLRDGVYLITGGLGNIGLELAETIARTVKAKLVLTGRSRFPARSKWDARLAAAKPGDGVCSRIERIRALERLGAEVLVAEADVTDAAKVKALVARVRKSWGTPHAVIHGAAHLQKDAFVPVAAIDRATAELQFGPKAHGLLHLQEALKDDPPALWILLSSISAVLGGLNLGAYAAANAFLDAEASRHNQAGNGTWISIGWDAWDFANPLARDVVTPAKGQDAFQRILAGELRHVVVAASPLAPRLAKWVNLGGAAVEAPEPGRPVDAAGPRHGAAHPRPDLATSYTAPRTDTERTVAGAWETFLGIAPVGVHDRFFELGGHSLLAIQVLARLREVFAMDLPVQRLFEAPTVAQLSESIDRDRGSRPPTLTGTAAPAGNGADIDEMMQLVDGLSDQEVADLLAQVEAQQAEGPSRHG